MLKKDENYHIFLDAKLRQFIRIQTIIIIYIAMGCTQSEYSQESIPVIRHLTHSQKQRITKTIENNDLISMAILIQEIQVYPNSEISQSKINWMLTHLCCRWDSYLCLQFLLRLYFIENPKGYINFVNTQTIEGFTCLHLCCIWNSVKCFKVLHDFGALSLNLKDSKLKTPYEEALEYRSQQISKILKQYKKLKIEFTYIKIEKLLEKPLIPPKETLSLQKIFQNEKKIEQPLSLNISAYENLTQVSIMTQDQNQLLAQKAEVQKQIGSLLQRKLGKELDYDLKLAFVCIYAEIQELQKQEYEKKEKEKLFLQLQKVEKQAEKQVSTKEERLKQLNLQIKKRQKQRLDKIKSQSQYMAESSLIKYNQLIIKRLKQKNQNLQPYMGSLKDSRSSRSVMRKSAHPILQKQSKIPAQFATLYAQSKKQGSFTDKQFPPQNSSIGDSSKSKYVLFTQDTIWLRPAQIFKQGEQFKLFDGIDPHDIKQGSLGVCYMLATVSALAANPKNIEKIFVFCDLQIGFYVLRLFVNGVPKLFVVDDLIPCCKTTKSPLFTQPIGKQIWVLLLEKAWAKLIGSYLSAQSMTPDHMMQDLSSAPAYGWWLTKQNAKTPTQKIKQLVKHSQKGHIVVVTSTSDKKIEGIVNNHAYSLLGVIQYNNRYVFKIRNPWGRFQWNGEFGEKSSLCTEEFKLAVGDEGKDDGVFFVSENQFLRAFCYYSISHIKTDYCYSYKDFQSKKGENLFFKFVLPKSCDVNLRITQPFSRMLNDRNYKYSPMIFQLGKILPQQSDSNDQRTETNSPISKKYQIQFISQGHQRTYFGAKSVHAFQDIFQNLQEGQYFVRIRMLWEDDKKYNKGVLGCYACSQVKIQRLDANEGLAYMKALFYSFSRSYNKNRVTNGYYTIATMKGQFLFIAETEQQGQFKANFKFTKQKMIRTETQLARLTEIELETKIMKNSYGVCTAMRIEPAQGGTTGPVSITITKI